MAMELTFLSRRRFLLSSAAAGPLFARMEPAPLGEWDGPAVIRTVFLGGRPSWPRPDLDLAAEVKGIQAQLGELEKRYPGRVRFTGSETISSVEQMNAWLAKPDDSDAVLAFPMVTITYPHLKRLVAANKPVLLFSVPYNGHDWSHGSAFMQQGARLQLIASSDLTALDPYIPLVRTIHHLRHSKVLLMSPQQTRPQSAPYTEQYGTSFAFPAYTDLKAAYDAADQRLAASMAGEFIRAASKVVEPTREEIESSLRLHLAILDLMRQQQANAIAIDCLGGFGRKELPAYPCISFSKLNDTGMYGVCENDLESTMTQLLVTSFSRRPGFVSDPVFDTSRNEVIHAHCVSATRLKGIDGNPSPYLVRSHLEDHKGASMQVLAPSGGPVTCAKFANATRLMISTGEALGNVDNERGCRTKIRTRVKDGERLLANWSKGLITGPAMPGTRDLLHRVVFYGDHSREIGRLGRLLGFAIVDEDAPVS
jgi:hypothetical protein